MKVIYDCRTSFLNRLCEIAKRGGQPKRAVEKVKELIFDIEQSTEWKPKANQITHNGETRIKSCIKYDLPGYYRLITVQESGCVFALFIGDHDECDRYLESHRGLRISINNITKKFEHSYEDVGLKEPSLDIIPDHDKTLDSFLSDKHKEKLGAQGLPLHLLAKLTKTSSENDVEQVLKEIENNNDSKWGVMIDLIENIRKSTLDAFVDALIQQSMFIDEIPKVEIDKAVKAESNTGVLIDSRDLTASEWDSILSGNFEDWMRFLHVDQRSIVYSDFEGPVLLRGISGSGKTSIIIHRALHLAEKYPEEKIAVLTLNPSLAKLLQSLIQKMNRDKTLTDRLIVLPLVEFEKKILGIIGVLDDTTNRLSSYSESGEKFFLDFFRQSKVQKKLSSIIKSLRDSYEVEPENYLHNEFVFIAGSFKNNPESGSRLKERNIYSEPSHFPRKGRAIPFSSEWRGMVLDCLELYEQELKDKNIEIPFLVAKKAHSFLDKINDNKASFDCRCILVDEAQDLSSVEIELLKTISIDAENSLFFAGDLRQQIFPKTNDFKAAGVVFKKKISLRKNYRNPREILEAGVELLLHYENDIEDKDSVELLSPEFSTRHSPKPLVIKALSTLQERLCHVEIIRSLKTNKNSAPICIIECNVTEGQLNELQKIKDIYLEHGVKVKLLHDTEKIENDTIYLADIDTIKGFEFSTVIISNCEQSKMPSLSLPKGEYWRDARRLYVAMTRARDELIFTHVNQHSVFLDQMKEKVQFSNTKEQGFDFHETEESLKLQKELDQLRQENEKLRRSEAYLSRTTDRFGQEWINFSKNGHKLYLRAVDLRSIKKVADELSFVELLAAYLEKKDILKLYRAINKMTERLTSKAIAFGYDEKSDEIEISERGKFHHVPTECLLEILTIFK